MSPAPRPSEAAPVRIEALTVEDLPWLRSFWTEHWGGPMVVTRGAIHRPEDVEGYVARRGKEVLGLATYRVQQGQCELVSLDSLVSGAGTGTRLIDAVRREAARRGCRRLWLITTNDNLPALRFYQRRGFTLSAVYANALERSRRLKPEIPLIGLDGIPLRDEIELEMPLAR